MDNDRMLRILIGMPDPASLGGPIACEPPFVEELRHLGHAIDEETYVFGDRPGGVPLRARVARVVGTARRLRARMIEAEFDVLHLNSSFDERALLRDAATLWIVSGSKVPVFIKFHGSDPDLFKKRPRLAGYVLARVQGIGLLSTEERENFVAAGIEEKKLFVIKNVVIPPIADVESPRSRWRIPDDIPLLLFAARFIPAKGLVDVIAACSKLRDDGRKFHLAAVGDGEQRLEAEREVERRGLSNQVTFTGYISESEVEGYYRYSTLLVFPTYHIEGFPMVIFRSVAAGLPVITTQIRGAADHLAEPDNCLWVRPRDPGQLAEAISRVLDHPELQASMQQNNRELARRFTAETVAPEYVSIYRSIVGSRQ